MTEAVDPAIQLALEQEQYDRLSAWIEGVTHDSLDPRSLAVRLYHFKLTIENDLRRAQYQHGDTLGHIANQTSGRARGYDEAFQVFARLSGKTEEYETAKGQLGSLIEDIIGMPPSRLGQDPLREDRLPHYRKTLRILGDKITPPPAQAAKVIVK